MLTSFRRMSKSTIGTIVLALFGVLIVASFALADVSGYIGGGGLGSSTLAQAGPLEVTDRDMSSAMQRRLAQVREENPEADYSAIAGDFDPLLQGLIDQRSLQAFARKFGFSVSKRLIDAEIANIPGVRGLDGRVSQEAYQQFLAQRRLTDADVRDIIEGGILQRLLITPAATSPRIPVGIATPYASMLLEAREGNIAVVPIEAFAAGLSPTDAQLQQFYQKNRDRYLVPEQRVLRIARIGPQQVANVSASDAEIAQYYQANQATYGAKDIRVISQAVVPDRNVAQQIAQRAKNQSFVEAVRPAGFSAEDISLGPQTRQEFTETAGEKVAAAAFSAPAGATIGPIQSEFGWHVVKIDSVERQAGKSLAQARAEIAQRLNAEKRTAALAELMDKLQDEIDRGANVEEAARAAGVPVTTTPLITASGVARGNPGFKMPQELEPVLKSGFELAPGDDPVIDQLPNDNGFAMVAPAEVVPAAPAPLASVREQVRSQWIAEQAAQRARDAANAIAARAKGPTSLAEAVKAVKPGLPPVRDVAARRIQLSEMGGQVPPPIQMMFTMGANTTRVVADPNSRAYFVVELTKITPGNALNQPGLITRIQREFQQPIAQEYAEQFEAAVRKQVDVRRNEEAIRAARDRIIGGGG